MAEDLLVLETFNLTFIIMLACFIISALVIVNKLHDRTEEYKRKFIFITYSVVLTVFIVYKLLIPLDHEYMEIYIRDQGMFTYWNELPFNPCNVAIIIVLVAMKTMKRPILICCFFLSLLGPSLALLMPMDGYSGYSLLSIHMFGFYFVHMAILMVPILLTKLDLYVPEYKDVMPAILSYYILAFIAFVIDIIFIETELCPIANYFFCMNTNGNIVLELLYGVISVPYVYLLTGIVGLIPLAFGIVWIYKTGVKLNCAIKKKKLQACDV